jgi:hypothetical protein
MDPDIRPWYHLLYLTDQIKNADQKAYLAAAVVCAVTGFSHQGFSWLLHYLVKGNPRLLITLLALLVLLLFTAGLVGTLTEFYRIVFPKIKNRKYLKNPQPSAIFWHDVAGMEFEDFKQQYLEEDREDDLIVQLYVLSKIAQTKYSRIKRLFIISVTTILLDVILLSLSKIAQG